MPLDELNTTSQIEVDKVFTAPDNFINREAQPIPKPNKEIGIDTQNQFFDNIVDAGVVSKIDISALQSFTSVSQSRNQIYDLLDTMCEDPTIAAILETYAEDATEYNDQGQIVWAEAEDANILKHINYLIETMRIDKHIYKWVHSLCKYGDVYLRLYRKSDFDEQDIFKEKETEADKELKDKFNRLHEDVYLSDTDNHPLNEDVNIKAYAKNDHYVPYVEMVANPAEMFELTRLGKTAGYIKADVKTYSQKNANQFNSFHQYKFKKNDVDVHSAMDYVHASLEDNSNRVPEEVDIFMDDNAYDNDEHAITYTVKRGQSLLQNVFKIWRELSLLENSVLLNRITKSAIVRLINVEVGDMPKEMVGPHLQGIKQLIEQKSAINEGNSLSEYTNPGPIENNVYVPTNQGKGAITTTQVGGDVNVGDLVDLDYFKNKFFGAMRVPKQYFGDTDDGAGFNGGQSLSIISSRYAKMIKRIQNTVIQAITDIINLQLIDKNLDSYVNKFTIHMLPPTTQEEIDRRANLSSKVQVASDIMTILSEVENATTKLKILKSLLSNIITDGEIIELIQGEIDRLEEAEKAQQTPQTDVPTDEANTPLGGMGGGDMGGFDSSQPLNLAADLGLEGGENAEGSAEGGEEVAGDTAEGGADDTLPSPEELGIGDLSDNNNPEI